MKRQLLKSVMCLTLSAIMVLSEASMATAAAPGETLDAVTASADSTEAGTESTETAVPSTESTETAVPSTESTEIDVPSTENTEIVVPSTENTETAAPSTEEVVDNTVDSVGKKVVDFVVLETVAGIGYDNKTECIYWNKVPNATVYNLKITNNVTGDADDYSTMATSYEFSDPGSYTVSIKAIDQDEYCPPIINISEADYRNNNYEKNENFGTSYETIIGDAKFYTIYNYPMSAGPAIFTFQIMEKPDYTNTKSSISGVVLKEVTDRELVFEIPNAPELLYRERFEWQVSNNSEFKKDAVHGLTCTIKSGEYGEEDKLIFPLSQFTPGETCYVRARVYSEGFKPDSSLSSPEWYAAKFGPFTSAAAYFIPETVISSVDTTVSGNNITLTAYLESGSATGFQFAKKVGKNWVVLAKQSDRVYKDSGLSQNVTYKYRVRGYSYNKLTGKTKYSGWKYVNAKTWGAGLKLKAAAASSTSVKLSWNKISGAKGYEIYRADTRSAGQNVTEGTADDNFANYTLVKTITKSSTSSYTDNKLTEGNRYDYLVRAYAVNGKNKSYINAGTSVTLNASGFQVQNAYYTSSGSYKVAWQKMTGIKGYKVEKINSATGEYDVIKKLSKSATSYTAAKVAVGGAGAEYRIRPYTSTKTYKGYGFTVEAKLGTVKNVKASATADGIKISWNPVTGADYYNVYRTTNTDNAYNKTTKTYNYVNGALVYDSAVDMTGYHPELGNSLNSEYAGTYRNTDIKTTSVVDRTIYYTRTAFDTNGFAIVAKDAAGNVLKNANGETIFQTEEEIWNKGPEKGVSYSYYVVAYANAPNGHSTSSYCESASDSKAAAAMFTSKSVKKVSKISSVKSQKKGEATISYKKASGASGYAIYRATSKKGTYVLVGTTTKTSYKDAGLTSGKTYYYKVASYTQSEAKANIYSAQTSYKSVKAK